MQRPTPPVAARPPQSWASALAVLGYGISVSILAGLVEAAIRRFGLPGVERLPDVGNLFFWILPVGVALVNLPIVALAAAGHRVWPGTVTRARAVMASTVIPALSISLAAATTRIADPVQLILALGVAAIAGRAVAARPEGFRRLLLVAAPVLFAIPPVTLAVLLASRARAARTMATAPSPGSPNVLLVIWDAVRRPSLSLYGYDRPTSPRLAARAAGGVVFDRAYSTAPWTLPSHASIFTGYDMQDLSTTWTAPLDQSRVVVSELFSRAGYRTAGFTANLMATHRPTGLARGFQHYEDWPPSRQPADYLGQLSLSARLRKHQPFRRWPLFQGYWKHAEDVNRSFLRWLTGSPEDRPWFAFLNYFDAHWPYRSTRALQAQFGAVEQRDRYDAAIAYLDGELERLLAELDRRGVLANTIVVVTSDHGEEFGEHGLEGHGGSLHALALNVPLVVIAPGRAPAGVRISPVVSTRHLGPTLVELAGLDSALGRLGGRSLARFWIDPGTAADTALAGVHQGINEERESQITGGRATTMIDDEYHYIRTGRGGELLFATATDFEERHNLIGIDSLKPVLERTRRYLSTRLGPDWVPRIH
jgi:arylsulfatase A-like enzyme